MISLGEGRKYFVRTNFYVIYFMKASLKELIKGHKEHKGTQRTPRKNRRVHRGSLCSWWRENRGDIFLIKGS